MEVLNSPFQSHSNLFGQSFMFGSYDTHPFAHYENERTQFLKRKQDFMDVERNADSSTRQKRLFAGNYKKQQDSASQTCPPQSLPFATLGAKPIDVEEDIALVDQKVEEARPDINQNQQLV